MSPWDELIAGHLSGSLSAAEEAEFARLQGAEPAFRARIAVFEEDEALLVALPRPVEPPELEGLAARVAAAAGGSPAALPNPVPAPSLAWRHVAVAASIAFALGVASTWAVVSVSDERAPSAAAGAVPVPTIEAAAAESPVPAAPPEPAAKAATVTEARPPEPAPAVAGVASETIPVRFTFVDPRASRVQLVGDFDGWGDRRLFLEPTGRDGVFHVVVWLPRGEHEYQFVVDGDRWVTDPLATQTRKDGFGAVNSVLSI